MEQGSTTQPPAPLTAAPVGCTPNPHPPTLLGPPQPCQHNMVCSSSESAPLFAYAFVDVLPLPGPLAAPLQVFYYLVMTFTGMLQGLVQLNLGSVTSFQVWDHWGALPATSCLHGTGSAGRHHRRCCCCCCCPRCPSGLPTCLEGWPGMQAGCNTARPLFGLCSHSTMDQALVSQTLQLHLTRFLLPLPVQEVVLAFHTPPFHEIQSKFAGIVPCAGGGAGLPQGAIPLVERGHLQEGRRQHPAVGCRKLS